MGLQNGLGESVGYNRKFSALCIPSDNVGEFWKRENTHNLFRKSHLCLLGAKRTFRGDVFILFQWSRRRIVD